MRKEEKRETERERERADHPKATLDWIKPRIRRRVNPPPPKKKKVLHVTWSIIIGDRFPFTDPLKSFFFSPSSPSHFWTAVYDPLWGIWREGGYMTHYEVYDETEGILHVKKKRFFQLFFFQGQHKLIFFVFFSPSSPSHFWIAVYDPLWGIWRNGRYS